MGTNTESLEKQYEVVKNETTTSHVMQYGDLVSYWSHDHHKTCHTKVYQRAKSVPLLWGGGGGGLLD